jgi:hypothetical protein
MLIYIAKRHVEYEGTQILCVSENQDNAELSIGEWIQKKSEELDADFERAYLVASSVFSVEVWETSGFFVNTHTFNENAVKELMDKYVRQVYGKYVKQAGL